MMNRIRTSIDEINRAYLKFYNTPEALAQIQVEPSQDLLNRENSGQQKNPIMINNNQVKQEPLDNIEIDTSIYNKVVNIQDKRKEIAKKWYQNPEKNR